jgi:hypothetical protein
VLLQAVTNVLILPLSLLAPGLTWHPGPPVVEQASSFYPPRRRANPKQTMECAGWADTTPTKFLKLGDDSQET